MDAYLLHLSAFQMDCPQWELISDSAKDLIQQMLAVDPKQRITIQEVLNHRWLRDRDKGLRIHLGDSVEELKKFNARRKLKAVVLSAVNSSKWYPYDDTNADSFSDFGDDEVSACAVSTILDSLDDIYCLQESHPQERAHLLALLEDTHLHVLLEVSGGVRSACPPSTRRQLAASTTAIDRRQHHVSVAATAAAGTQIK
jgi:calcium/calmodulin-dependent serine protein kinase